MSNEATAPAVVLASLGWRDAFNASVGGDLFNSSPAVAFLASGWINSSTWSHAQGRDLAAGAFARSAFLLARVRGALFFQF
jgi:hypothetical protein